MSEITGVQQTKASFPDVDLNENPILRYATLQLKLAGEEKQIAVANMDFLNNEKKEQAATLEKLSVFKSKYETAVAEHRQVTMTAAEIQWCKDRGIEIPWDPPATSDANFGIDDWNTIVKNTQKYLDGISSDAQSIMVVIQDALGQYNAFTQGASANIRSVLELMSTAAKW